MPRLRQEERCGEAAQSDRGFRARGAAARRGRQGHLDLQRRELRRLGASGGVGTFSGVNADSYNEQGELIPQLYHGRTRRERHEELVAYAIDGGIQQARVAYEMSRRRRPHPYERAVGDGGGRAGAARRARRRPGPHPRRHLRRRHAVPHRRDLRPLRRPLLPDRVLGPRLPRACGNAPITSFATGSAAWSTRTRGWPAAITGSPMSRTRRSPETGLSAGARAAQPDGASSASTRRRSSWPAASGGCASGSDWLDNPELGPVAFQFGTRPLLTQESPISDAWKAPAADPEARATSTSTASARPASIRPPCATISSTSCSSAAERQVAFRSSRVGRACRGLHGRRCAAAWFT